MRIALVHGYFLSDSGSGIYVRELAKQFTRDGYDVTLVCQEQNPEEYEFIDACYETKTGNTSINEVFTRRKVFAGSCRMVRPDIENSLLTYVTSSNRRFRTSTFQESSLQLIEEYIKNNVIALKSIFNRWPQDFIQTNHAIMQPFEVREALKRQTPYCVTIHGSALNFSVKSDMRMKRFFIEGIKGASSVIALSDDSAQDVTDYAASLGVDIERRVSVIPPGVDTTLFKPRKDRAPLGKVLSKAGSGATVAVQAGRLLWTKGAQYAVAAVPLICQAGCDFNLILVGDGPMEAPLRELIDLMDKGRIKEARSIVNWGQAPLDRRKGPDPMYAQFGPVIPELGREEEKTYVEAAKGKLKKRIHFTGHISHDELAPLFGVADLTLMPSVFPEAYGLSAAEGFSCGALPVAAFHSGLAQPLNLITDKLCDPKIRSIIPGIGMTRAIANGVIHILDRYPTQDHDFRDSLHKYAENSFSWARTAETYIMLFKE